MCKTAWSDFKNYHDQAFYTHILPIGSSDRHIVIRNLVQQPKCGYSIIFDAAYHVHLYQTVKQIENHLHLF